MLKKYNLETRQMGNKEYSIGLLLMILNSEGPDRLLVLAAAAEHI